MKFGDQVKLTDEFWKKLTDVINSDRTFSKIKIDSKYNKFLCLKFRQRNTAIWLGSLDIDFTNVCGAVSVSTWNSSVTFQAWSFWENYQSVGGIGSRNISIDSYYGDEEMFPDNWEEIVPKKTIIFRLHDGFLPYEGIKPKMVQTGASCLLCKDYNPWMESNSFCYRCSSDPRNKYKIEEILVKMAFI